MDRQTYPDIALNTVSKSETPCALDAANSRHQNVKNQLTKAYNYAGSYDSEREAFERAKAYMGPILKRIRDWAKGQGFIN